MIKYLFIMYKTFRIIFRYESQKWFKLYSISKYRASTEIWLEKRNLDE